MVDTHETTGPRSTSVKNGRAVCRKSFVCVRGGVVQWGGREGMAVHRQIDGVTLT